MFCEQQLYSFVREPANTWSNIGYLIVAVFIFLSNDSYPKRLKKLCAASCACLFVGSTLLHLTGARLGGLADVGSMFFVVSVALSSSFQRLFDLKESSANLVLLFILGLSMSCLLILRFDDSIFAAQVLLLIVLEWRLLSSQKALNSQKLLWALVTQSVAFIIWILDVKKILCDPENHIISGHAVWHLLSAATIYLFFQSYKNYGFINENHRRK